MEQNKQKLKIIRNRLKGRIGLKNEIRRRDGNKCQVCGSQDNLQVTHKLALDKHPELAFDPYNLQLLCNKCKWKRRKLRTMFF